jgi:hypothetical protein
MVLLVDKFQITSLTLTNFFFLFGPMSVLILDKSAQMSMHLTSVTLFKKNKRNTENEIWLV